MNAMPKPRWNACAKRQRKMRRKNRERDMKASGWIFALCCLSSMASAETAKPAWPSMAPVAEYLIPRDAEIALARSSAPDSIAKDAEVMVFTRTGFQTAVKGTNGFVCLVRSEEHTSELQSHVNLV